MAHPSKKSQLNLKTIREAADFFGVTDGAIRRWIRAGTIPAFRRPTGSIIGIPAEALTMTPAIAAQAQAAGE